MSVGAVRADRDIVPKFCVSGSNETKDVSKRAASYALAILFGVVSACAVAAFLQTSVLSPKSKPKLSTAQVLTQTQGRPIAIVPAPRSLVRGSGAFLVTPQTTLTFAPGLERVADYFAELVQKTLGITLATRVSTDAKATDDIRFVQTAATGADAASEAYEIVVTPERILVSAAGVRGLFYGAVTLWQLFDTGELFGPPVAPAVTIKDAPRFAWRGLMLDSARHFQSPAFIRRFIDQMALHKLNVLHWHLTDDQGWRLQIRKYPKLTEVGAWRVPAGAARTDIDPLTDEPRLYGGFYTQQQVREIVAYAATRNVTIVPEIEMPGHASAAVTAYPELGIRPFATVPADWGVYEQLFNVDESTFAFLEDVLSEVIELFPGEYIHIGGDEAVKTQWQESESVQARMRQLRIKDERALQSYFVQRIGKFLASQKRRLIGWDEILEGGLAPDATVMSWRGIDGAKAAAAAGHDTVLSPAPILYFDNRPSDAIDNPPGRARIVSMQDVYNFDPAPASIPAEQQKHILGVQANLWTEHMRLEERVEYMAFPRAAALAEVAWSPASRIDWADFQKRLPAQKRRYALTGTAYATSDGVARIDNPAATMRTSQELKPCTDKIAISLEDDAPLQGERAVFLVDIMNPCWIYPAVDLGKVAGLAVNVGQLPFNFQIGDDIYNIPLPKPQSDDGELEVRVDSCEGPPLATIPLESAVENSAVTKLPPTRLPAKRGVHDLCFMFTRTNVDPIWVIDRVTLLDSSSVN
ncbi:MAG: family 20 glycosylhydrolase [Steroidobacteraceae bacterium]